VQLPAACFLLLVPKGIVYRYKDGQNILTIEKDFDEGLGKDSGNWAGTLLWAMRGQNEQDDAKRKELSPAEFQQYLGSCFSRSQLLVMQMFLRNEEFNELGNRIISDMLKQKLRRISMKINEYFENGSAVIAPVGKIDHITVGEFEEKINELSANHDTIILDMAGVEYVSSAALRAILNANDLLEGKGGLKLRNVNKNILEILNITGFTEYLDII